MLLATSVYSQSYNDSNDWQSQQSSSSRQTSQSGSKSRQQTISGEIEGFRHVNLWNVSGARDKHSFVRVRMADGRSYIADLGPKANLDQFDLQQGDRVQAQGHFANISGRRVFVVNRAQVNGESFAVQQSRQISTRGQFAQTNTGRSETLTGTIQGFRHTRVRGSQGAQETHTLAKIQTSNGGTRTVDLGPKSGLDDLNLTKGQRIRVQGTQGTLDGQQMLLVEHLSRMNRQSGSAQQQPSRQKSGGQVTVQGTVQGYQVMSLGTGEQQRVLLQLDLANGRSVLVDAGQYQPGELDLKNLNLGDRVTIKAHNISGNSNNGSDQQLIADSIRFQKQDATGSSGGAQSSSGKSQSGNNSAEQKSAK